MANLKDLIVNGSARVLGSSYASTPDTADNSDKVATTSWVKSQGYATTSGSVSSAEKLTTARTIDGVDFDGSANINHYGVCDTTNTTQTKEVTITGFKLETGAHIEVKFTNNQNYNGVPKLNVNGTGAKDIKSNGTTNAGRYYWNAGEVIDFTYDGTYWLMDNGGIASTTYYGRTKLLTSATSTSEALASTPKALNSLVQTMIEPYAVYSTSATYAVGDRVRYNYQAWECNTAISTAESWNAAHWTALDPIQTQLDSKANSSALSGYVPTTRKVNNKALSADISLTASDVGALPSSTVVPTTTSSVTSGSSAALTSGGAYTNLVRRKSTSAATGSASQGVYVDANGQVQTCDAVTSTYSSTGTAPVNGTAVKSAIDTAIASVYKPAGSVAFASLPTPAKSLEGNVYDVTDAFTTDSKFVTSGQSYPAGTNVVVINTTGTTYKYDVLAGFVDLSGYVPTTRKVNNKALSADISLTASDVGAVASNTAITGATKCKITYDSKGLVTAGANLAASDIPNLTLSKITDVTATASELNVLDGITATTTELNYTDGVTSNIQTQLNAKAADNAVVKLTGNQEISGTKTFNAEIKGVFATYQSHNSETGGYYRKIGEIILTGAYQSAVVPFYYYKDAVNVTETGYTGKISLRVDGTAGTFGPNNSGVVLGEYPDWINNGNMAFYVLYKNNTPESNKVTCQVWTYVKNAWDGFKIMPLSYHGCSQSNWTWSNNPTGVTELPSDYTAINQKFARMYITAPNEDTTSSAQLDTVGARNTKLSNYSTTANTVSAVVAGTSANQIKVTKNGSDSTITVNNVANATNATKATQDASGNVITTTYLQNASQGNLLPNFNTMSVIETKEFDTSDSDYHVICTRTNTDSSESELNDVLYFRITVTGTNINQVGDYAVILPGKINCQPFVIANMFSGTSNSAYGGNRYLGYVYPKALNSGYKWEICILNNRNNSARHYKVEVFKTNSKCTWSAGTATTYNSTYHNRGTMDVETRYGYVFNYMYGAVTSADNATQLSSRLSKFINCTINTAGAALLANQFVYQNGNSLYPGTDKTKAIEPGFGIQLCTTAYSNGNSVGWDNLRQKVSVTSLTNIPHATLARGNPCYFRCTMDANSNILSDNYVATSMANGYTWYYIGVAQSTTAIALDTTQSFFMTLDSNGKLTHVNGKPIASGTTYSAGTGLSLSGTTFDHSNSVTAATAGTSSATSGSTLAVPYITYDAQGHITASGTHTHTVTGFSTTDTKNTAGSTDTSSKIFLVGATSQAANPQTYSHDTAFVDTNGRLNSAAPASGANDTTVATTKWVKDQSYVKSSTKATTSALGLVKPDGTTITVDSAGTISAVQDTMTMVVDEFTMSAAGTTITLTSTPASKALCWVNICNTDIVSSEWSLSGNTITLSTSIPKDTWGQVRYFTNVGGVTASSPLLNGIATITSGALTLQASKKYYTTTVAGNTTFTITAPSTSDAIEFYLHITHTSGTITFPSSVKWVSTPTFSTGKKHLIKMISVDGGTTYLAQLEGSFS